MKREERIKEYYRRMQDLKGSYLEAKGIKKNYSREAVDLFEVLLNYTKDDSPEFTLGQVAYLAKRVWGEHKAVISEYEELERRYKALIKETP